MRGENQSSDDRKDKALNWHFGSNGHEFGQNSIRCLVRSRGERRLAWLRYDALDRILEAFQEALDPQALVLLPEVYPCCVAIWEMKT